MTIKLGSASIDENGNARGGAVGDQTGKEIKVQSFYDFPWNVYLECPDKAMAEKAASFMERVCLDENFGYDQLQRETGYNSIVANGNKVKGAKGEFDCSSLVSACYKLAGLNISVGNTTYTLREVLSAKGFKVYTDDAHVHSDKFATRGGIYLSEQHHVVMALENGSSAGAMTLGSTGDDVKLLQTKLNKLGYNLTVDGDFGPKTQTALISFQKNNSITADGVAGANTISAIDAMVKKLETPKKKDYIQIITEVSDGSADEWIAGIKAVVAATKAEGSLGDFEILKYLPELIEKLGNK